MTLSLSGLRDDGSALFVVTAREGDQSTYRDDSGRMRIDVAATLTTDERRELIAMLLLPSPEVKP